MNHISKKILILIRYNRFFNWSYFCSGIKRLQTILLKVALVLGAQIYAGVGFVNLQEPDDDHDSSGWRINSDVPDHPINLLNIDVLIGAEGKRVTVPGGLINHKWQH